MICCRYYTAARYVEGKQVLEVGCGAGLGLGYLSKRAEWVIGGDYDEANLRCAKQHYKRRVELLSLDAHELPFIENYFDIVVAMEVIFYLHLDRFLEECNRVLRKKGYLVSCIPNKDSPNFRKSELSYKYYSVPELFTTLKNHNFEADLFGAFPTEPSTTQHDFITTTTEFGRKTLSKIPKGGIIRGFLSNKIRSKNIVLKDEIEEGMAENVQLTSLSNDSPNFRYRILYIIAQAI